MSEFGDYVRHGWHVVPIVPGLKSPVTKGWQRPENAITDAAVADWLEGAGLLHAYSGTCCLDIDDFAAACDWLILRGIDLQGLWDAPDAVRLISGKPNRGKLVYALPGPLPSRKIVIEGNSVIDFRCAARNGMSVQDVLPPTIHPGTGQPYRWEFDALLTDWRTPPELPAAVHALWLELMADDAGAAPAPAPAPSHADAEAIRQVLARKDPDCDRDSWVKVLAQVHHETNGEDWGLHLADEWSRRGAKYKSFDDVATRWRSFNVSRVGAATLGVELGMSATEDDFPPVPEDEREAVERSRESSAKAIAAKAIASLERRLVYVRNLDQYFDTEIRYSIPTDHAIRHTFTSEMPFVRTASGKKQRLDPVKLLQESNTKRVVELPGFHPGEGPMFTEGGLRYVNEYGAAPVEPITPTADELARIEWLFNRIDDATFRHWLKQFYGHAVQYPGVKILSAPLLWSDMTGNGKSTLVGEIPELLFGRRYSQQVSHGMLASEFNDYLIGKWFVHLSELHADQRGERNKIAAKLKAWITDPLAINVKGARGYTTRNSLIITASSNSADAATIENNDRRWGIHELRAERMTTAEAAWLFEGFLRTPRAPAVLRSYFMGIDLTGFAATAPAIETSDRKAMIMASLAHDVALIHDAIQEKQDIFSRDVFSSQELAGWLRAQGVRFPPSPQKLGRVLAAPPLNCVQLRVATPVGAMRMWCCRNFDIWGAAPGASVYDHWTGQDDPLTA